MGVGNYGRTLAIGFFQRALRRRDRERVAHGGEGPVLRLHHRCWPRVAPVTARRADREIEIAIGPTDDPAPVAIELDLLELRAQRGRGAAGKGPKSSGSLSRVHRLPTPQGAIHAPAASFSARRSCEKFRACHAELRAGSSTASSNQASIPIALEPYALCRPALE